MNSLPEGIRLRPWERDGFRGVVSLFEMLNFFASAYVQSVTILSQLEIVATANEAIKPESRAQNLALVVTHTQMLRGYADLYGFTSTSAQCSRIAVRLDALKLQMSNDELREMLRSLRERCEDDLGSHYFLHLSPDEADKYQNPTKDWEAIGSRFYKVKFNIEEGGKCFALGRYGAAVFHILQVAEYGVIQLAQLLQVAGDKPGWGNLDKLEALIKEPFPKRTDLAQKHSKLLESVVPLAKVIKDRWRHKLHHVDNQIIWNDTDFGIEVADEIITATRGFMRNLAKELPQ